VIAINRFDADTDAEVALLKEQAARLGCEAVESTHFRDGGAGAEALAARVQRLADSGRSQFRTLYDDEMPLWTRCAAWRAPSTGGEGGSRPEGAGQVPPVRRDRRQLPVCIAKTQYSFSTDPGLIGAPTDHTVSVRDVVLATAPSSRWCSAATS